MRQMTLGKSGPRVPVVAVGCMRVAGLEEKALAAHLDFCLEHGLNFFDHADIYRDGECERRFAGAFRQTGHRREEILLQGKCGIRPGMMYDFSKDYILRSVDGILQRLGTDYLDVLVLHRPDALMEPEEVAEAFDILQDSGKVRHFGVSNHRPGQVELLKKYVRQELIVNQLQLSIPFSSMISAGMEANMRTDGAVDRDGGVLDYCRLNDMTIQAWSPFRYGFVEGVFVGNHEKYGPLNQALEELGGRYGATPTAIAAAWVLRHPAKVQLIAGTTNTARMAEVIKGSEITLEREEWYRLYLSSGHILP
jgi:predicted oxidoreductase